MGTKLHIYSKRMALAASFGAVASPALAINVNAQVNMDVANSSYVLKTSEPSNHLTSVFLLKKDALLASDDDARQPQSGLYDDRGLGEDHGPGDDTGPGEDHGPGNDYGPGEEHGPGNDYGPGEEHGPGEDYGPTSIKQGSSSPGGGAIGGSGSSKSKGGGMGRPGGGMPGGGRSR